MLRRIIFVFILVLLTGCAKGEAGAEDETRVYYISLDETMIDFIERDLSGDTVADRVSEVIAIMGDESPKKNLKSVFSDTAELLDVKVEDEMAILTMGENYRLLKPTTEVLTRAALVRSLCQVEGISYVSMQIGETPLSDVYGNAIGIMEASQFLDNTGTEINPYEKTSIKLYFTDFSGNSLQEITRQLNYNTNISLERLVVEQLIRGPYTGEVFPTINPDTKVLGVTVKDGICYVNLDETFLIQNVNATPETTIYSITNSLAELPNVNKVQVSVNGSNEGSFGDKLSLSALYERNLDIVK